MVLPEDDALREMSELGETQLAESIKEAAPEIPNGGLKAWSQVGGSFFLILNTWYGTQAYLVRDI